MVFFFPYNPPITTNTPPPPRPTPESLILVRPGSVSVRFGPCRARFGPFQGPFRVRFGPVLGCWVRSVWWSLRGSSARERISVLLEICQVRGSGALQVEGPWWPGCPRHLSAHDKTCDPHCLAQTPFRELGPLITRSTATQTHCHGLS